VNNSHLAQSSSGSYNPTPWTVLHTLRVTGHAYGVTFFINLICCKLYGTGLTVAASEAYQVGAWLPVQPALSPNSRAHSSNSCRPCLLTLGLILTRLASKSSNWIGRIWSMGVYRRASPNFRRGPIAASFAKAVMSDPEKPVEGPVNSHSNQEGSSSETYHQSVGPASQRLAC